MNGCCLVTGAGGFVGRHLVVALVARGYRVVALTRGPAGTDSKALTWVEADLLDRAAVRAVVDRSTPDFVYHLAASMPGSSLEELMTTNVLGTDSLFDALTRSGHRVGRVLAAGSAAEYGCVGDGELPVTERQPLRPLSPYGLSKAAQSLLAEQYHLRHALPVVRTRCFNLTGPGEPPSLVAGAVAKQIAAIERGLKAPELSVGNLSGERDFLDIRDAVQGLVELCEKGRVGSVYNLCSGRPRRIDAILSALLRRAGEPITVVQDPARVAASEVSCIYGDARRAREETGWAPRITFETSIDDLLAYWRDEVARTPAAA